MTETSSKPPPLLTEHTQKLTALFRQSNVAFSAENTSMAVQPSRQYGFQ